MANCLLLLGLALGLFVLLRVTDDVIFATILLVVFGLVWARCLLVDRSSRRPRHGNNDGRANGSSG